MTGASVLIRPPLKLPKRSKLMKNAAHSLLLLILLLVCATAQELPPPILAQGGPEKLWVAHVLRNPEFPDGREMTIVRVKTTDATGAWNELARINARVVGLAHRRSQLAILLGETTEVRSVLFVWRDG